MNAMEKDLNMLNNTQIIGRLGQDVETKTLDSGVMVAKISVGTSEKWVDKSGQKQERTEWFKVVVFGKLADICAKYLQKGTLVYFQGKMQTRSWEDNQGVKRYITELVASEMKILSGTLKEKQEESSNYNPFDDFNSDDEMPF